VAFRESLFLNLHVIYGTFRLSLLGTTGTQTMLFLSAVPLRAVGGDSGDWHLKLLLNETWGGPETETDEC